MKLYLFNGKKERERERQEKGREDYKQCLRAIRNSSFLLPISLRYNGALLQSNIDLKGSRLQFFER